MLLSVVLTECAGVQTDSSFAVRGAVDFFFFFNDQKDVAYSKSRSLKQILE